jgi:hypothetical protein
MNANAEMGTRLIQGAELAFENNLNYPQGTFLLFNHIDTLSTQENSRMTPASPQLWRTSISIVLTISLDLAAFPM